MKGWGPKVQYVPPNQGNLTFLAGYPGVPEEFEKKIVFNFRTLVSNAS